MRQHHFQLRDLNGRDGLICISSKYALYQGLSNKVMQALRRERLKTQLPLMCINKAWDLSQFDNKTLHRQFNINVERTSRELAGEYYISLTEDVEPKKMIACTRSFSERVTDYQGLRTAISTFVANASRKLREQRQYAACVQVFVRASPFDTKGMQYGMSVSVPLPCPTYDTRDLLAAAVAGLQQIYIEGPKYAKGRGDPGPVLRCGHVH